MGTPALHSLCVDLSTPTLTTRDVRDGDLAVAYQQDHCAEPETGRRRDLEVSAPRQAIKDFLAERGMVRPPHSSWGRSNASQ